MTTDTRWQPFGVPPEAYEDTKPRNGTRVLNLTLRGRRDGGPASKDRAGGWLLAAASVLLLALAVTQGFVSWHQQFVFVLAAKHDRTVSGMEAVGLDSAAVIFAVLAVAQARLGRPARIERALNLGCALGSMLMNVLGADLGSPRSVAVYVLPPVLYAAGSDRLISVVRRQALSRQEDTESQRSVWHVAGLAVLYFLRFLLAPPSTATGMRRWVLASAPVPGAPQNVAVLPAAPTPGSTAIPTPQGAQPPAGAGHADVTAGPGRGHSKSKRAQLIRAYEDLGKAGDPRYGDKAQVSPLAKELGERVGLQWGSARTYLGRHLASTEGTD